MKAAQVMRYSKDNIKLKLNNVAKPAPKANQVLIKVTAAGVNPVDNMITRGEVRLITPYKLPLTAGNEVVGRVVELGENVSEFKEGERVFSRLPLESIGAFADYVAVDQAALAKVPEYLTDEQAVAIPLTALTVMQAFELMDVKPKKTIYISGGTGSVGAMAIPLAKAKGLKVITNGNAINKQRVLELGADQFIDYKTEDYTKIVHDVDYVLDTVGGKETEKQMQLLKKGGALVSLRGVPNKEFAKSMSLPLWKQWVFGIVGRKMDKLAKDHGVSYHFIYVKSNGAQLKEATTILADKNVVPALDKVYPFSEVNDALSKVANGRSRGKTVLKF